MTPGPQGQVSCLTLFFPGGAGGDRTPGPQGQVSRLTLFSPGGAGGDRTPGPQGQVSRLTLFTPGGAGGRDIQSIGASNSMGKMGPGDIGKTGTRFRSTARAPYLARKGGQTNAGESGGVDITGTRFRSTARAPDFALEHGRRPNMQHTSSRTLCLGGHPPMCRKARAAPGCFTTLRPSGGATSPACLGCPSCCLGSPPPSISHPRGSPSPRGRASALSAAGAGGSSSVGGGGAGTPGVGGSRSDGGSCSSGGGVRRVGDGDGRWIPAPGVA